MKYERVLSLSHEMIFQCQAHLWLDDRHVPGAWRSSPFVAGFLMIDECTTNTTVCVRRLGVWVPHHRWSHHSSELACLDDFIRSIHGSAPSTSSGHSVFDTRASQLNCRPETNKYKKKNATIISNAFVYENIRMSISCICGRFLLCREIIIVFHGIRVREKAKTKSIGTKNIVAYERDRENKIVDEPRDHPSLRYSIFTKHFSFDKKNEAVYSSCDVTKRQINGVYQVSFVFWMRNRWCSQIHSTMSSFIHVRYRTNIPTKTIDLLSIYSTSVNDR